jgi:hypothetical protein
MCLSHFALHATRPTDTEPLHPPSQGAGMHTQLICGVVSFLRHGSDLLSWLFTTFDLDQLMRASQDLAADFLGAFESHGPGIGGWIE